MKKATKDFAAWIRSVDGIERTTRDYERGRLTLMEYIAAVRAQECQNMVHRDLKNGTV